MRSAEVREQCKEFLIKELNINPLLPMYDGYIDACVKYASQFREPSTQGEEETIAIQDRMIGELTRDRDYYKDSYSRRQDWLRQAKAEAGADDRDSFDNVWKDTLEKAKEYERLKQENEVKAKAVIELLTAFNEYAEHRREKGSSIAKVKRWNNLVFKMQALNPKD